jgi:hypothetical protein
VIPEFGQTKVPFPDGTILVTDEQAALLDGARSRAEAYAILNEHPELYRCDFCSRPGVAVSYDAVDFDTGNKERDGASHVSRGGWAACQECADLIEADDREALADRSMESYGELRSNTPEHRARVRQALRDVHDEFYRHRRGPGRPGVWPTPIAGLEQVIVTDTRMFVFDGRRRLARRE